MNTLYILYLSFRKNFLEVLTNQYWSWKFKLKLCITQGEVNKNNASVENWDQMLKKKFIINFKGNYMGYKNIFTSIAISYQSKVQCWKFILMGFTLNKSECSWFKSFSSHVSLSLSIFIVTSKVNHAKLVFSRYISK